MLEIWRQPCPRRDEGDGGRSRCFPQGPGAAVAASNRGPNLPPPPCWTVRSPLRASVTARVGERGWGAEPSRKSEARSAGAEAVTLLPAGQSAQA